MRNLVVWLVLIMVLAWAGAFFVVKTHHDRIAKQGGAVVDRLDVPDAWTVVSEHVEREQFICFNNKPCPSLSRTWQADRVVGTEDVRRLARTAGWDFEIDGTCERGPDAIGMIRLCSAVTELDGYRVRLHVDSPESGSASLVRLRLSTLTE